MKNQLLPFTTATTGFILFAVFVLGFNTYYPHLDDFEPLLLLKEYDLNSTFLQDFDLLFKPINEHRVVVLKSVLLIGFKLFHLIDLKVLSILSFFPYLFFLYFIQTLFKKEEKIWVFSSLFLLLFSFGNYFSETWLILNYQRNGVIGFGLLGLFFSVYRTGKSNFIFAVIFSLLSALSNSDGLFFLLINGISFLIRKKWRLLISWYLVVIIFYILFFVRYPSGTMLSNSFQYFTLHPSESFFAFFILIGSNFNLWIDDPISNRLLIFSILGFLLIVSYLFLLFRALKKENVCIGFGVQISNHHIFHICFLLYFLVVTGTLSILRTQSGMDSFLLSNHRIFSIMLQFMITLLLFQQFRVSAITKWMHVGICLFSMLLFTSNLPFMYQNLNRKYAEVFNFYNGKGGLGMDLSAVRKYQIDKNINYLLKNGGLVMPNKINSWKMNYEKLFKNPPLNRTIKLNGEVAIWKNPPLKTYFQEIFIVEKSGDDLYAENFEPQNWFKFGNKYLQSILYNYKKLAPGSEIYFVNISENKVERIN